MVYYIIIITYFFVKLIDILLMPKIRLSKTNNINLCPRLLLASCHGDRCVRVCSVRSGRVVRTLSAHQRTVWAASFHPTDSDRLATACLHGEVRLWQQVCGQGSREVKLWKQVN